MKPRLLLSLTGAQLVLEVAQSAADSGLPGLLRSLPFFGAAKGSAVQQEPAARVRLAGESSQFVLRARLEEALLQLEARCDNSLRGLNFDVQLGLDHARIGLMTLEGMTATALTAEARESYAQAWVAQMLHLDPEAQIIRWQVLADAHKLLVSCVDRRVFDTVNAFAIQHGLRFASCRPAILSAVGARQARARRAAALPRALTVVWTEAGADAERSPSVQLLRFEGSQLWSTWRGWIPRSSLRGGNDTMLEGALRRFQTRHMAQAEDAVTHLHWPASALESN
jgi:hypothetical protein